MSWSQLWKYIFVKKKKKMLSLLWNMSSRKHYTCAKSSDPVAKRSDNWTADGLLAWIIISDLYLLHIWYIAVHLHFLPISRHRSFIRGVLQCSHIYANVGTNVEAALLHWRPRDTVQKRMWSTESASLYKHTDSLLQPYRNANSHFWYKQHLIKNRHKSIKLQKKFVKEMEKDGSWAPSSQ